MDKTFEKFLQSGINLAPVGIQHHKDHTSYFCTPKGASILGWAGVDGIHFCFIRKFGTMVFSVNPMDSAPNYVHPLAKNFADFLRLLLACGHEAALEQAWMWDESQFETFLRENPITEEQQQTLSEISEKLKLSPMEQPWAYIKALQSAFDYSKIPYTEDYYDIADLPAEFTLPDWNVYFDANFWGHHGRDRAGKEIRLDQPFDWAGYHWVIPAVYSCSKGLVVDFCMQVDSEKIRKHRETWNLNRENDSPRELTQDQQMQMEWDDPLHFYFNSSLTLNGKELKMSHGCAVSFNPCLPDGMINELEAKWVIDYYRLDPSYGWVIYRNAFPWSSKRRPEIKSLTLTMEQHPERLPGTHFKVHAPGDSFTFIHPISQKTHTLTVQEIEQQTIPQNHFASPLWIYPTHYIAMSYTISPEPAQSIALFDCNEGDHPVEIAPKENSFQPIASNACLVGVIGSVDGPTAIVCGTDVLDKLHAACSSLHFEPVHDDIEWHLVFYVKQFDDASFSLI